MPHAPCPPPSYLQGDWEVVSELGGEEQLRLPLDGTASGRTAQLDDVHLALHLPVLEGLLGKGDHGGGGVAPGELQGGQDSGFHTGSGMTTSGAWHDHRHAWHCYMFRPV